MRAMAVVAWLYDLHEHIFKNEASQERAELLEILGNTNHKKLLEAGAGTCRFSAFIKKSFPDTDIYAADISRKYLTAGAKKADIKTIRCATEELPQKLGSDFFDIVLMIDTLHHHADRSWALKSVFEVLKPGGLLVMREVDREKRGFFRYKLIDKTDLLFSALQGLKYRAPQYFSAAELRALLELIGFREIKIKPLGRKAFILCKAIKPAGARNKAPDRSR